MAITRRFCENHPDRAAIGVCVITRMAICEECSTRYEGVNYSREGLRILQERRAQAQAPAGLGVKKILAAGGTVLAAPAFFLLLVAGIYIVATAVTNMVVR
jgi:hypothetical protein